MRREEPGCDLLIAHYHPPQPIELDAERYEMLPLDDERLSPYVKPNAQSAPIHTLPGTPARPLPYLAHAPGAYLGRAVEHMFKQSKQPVYLDRIYETDMAEGLKVMPAPC